MELTFAPRGILQIDDARIAFRNFRGEGDKFNREGDRNFVLIIPTEDMADALVKEAFMLRGNTTCPHGRPLFVSFSKSP